MHVNQAHQALLSFSRNNAGIGISIELIKRLVNDQLRRMKGSFQNMVSNQRFKGTYKVSFSGDYNTSNLQFKFVNVVNPVNANEFFPQVEIANLKINIDGILENKSVVSITVDFPKIIGIIQLIDKNIKISLFNETHFEGIFIKKWEIDPTLRSIFESNPYDFKNDDWNELVLYFKATSIFSGRDIAESFIASLNLPDIFKIFNGIKFGDQAKLGADSSGNLLMFTADSSINFSNCPTYNATGQTKVTSFSKVQGKTNVYTIGETPKNEAKILVETNINDNSETLKYPTKSNPENISTGDVFLFTPIELLRVNFNEVKPALTVSESDNFGPIYWRYSVTASVKSIGLNLINNWPIEFRLSIPTEVTGQAGAGIKIGCIRYEALGAMFDGKVKPFDINFKIHLDWQSMQIVFISKIENIKGINFSFRTFPSLEFPISEILDFILARAAEYLITNQADKMLNVTRIPIANLGILEKFAKIRQNSLAGATDAIGNVTMGVELIQIP